MVKTPAVWLLWIQELPVAATLLCQWNYVRTRRMERMVIFSSLNWLLSDGPILPNLDVNRARSAPRSPLDAGQAGSLVVVWREDTEPPSLLHSLDKKRFPLVCWEQFVGPDVCSYTVTSGTRDQAVLPRRSRKRELHKTARGWPGSGRAGRAGYQAVYQWHSTRTTDTLQSRLCVYNQPGWYLQCAAGQRRGKKNIVKYNFIWPVDWDAAANEQSNLTSNTRPFYLSHSLFFFKWEPLPLGC